MNERFDLLAFFYFNNHYGSLNIELCDKKMCLLTRGSTFNLRMCGTDLLLRTCGRAVCTKWYSVRLPKTFNKTKAHRGEIPSFFMHAQLSVRLQMYEIDAIVRETRCDTMCYSSVRGRIGLLL